MSKMNNKPSSSVIDLDGVNAQVIDLTNDHENMLPPPPPSTNNKRKMPLQVSSKKMMMLQYDKVLKPVVFFGYRMFYLSRPQQVIFEERVKIFQCNKSLSTSEVRLGVADIQQQDRMSLTKLWNNIGGSLPITVNQVRRPMEEEDEVMFVSLKKEKACLYGKHGKVISIDKFPKVCEARLALTFSGMKVKEEEASFIMSVSQIMVKQELGGGGGGASKATLLFPVSSDDDDDEPME